MSFLRMSEVRWTAALGLLDFLQDVKVVAVRPVLPTRFAARLVLPSAKALASKKGRPGTATVISSRHQALSWL
jgi:hypothetical protein